MKRTKTMAVAKVVCGANGRGHMIFNDKLVDGTRSLKVWGWCKEDYEQAQRMLDLLGCDAKVVQFTKYFARANTTKTVTRLHVKE
jgi:hypothetical protein